ncbi:MAG: 50S ribosomal protein L6 [Burkholderiales bacterium]|jgi:large subunit ribosomal protein L6|nr:50S ribosomal protein L6 [Burkholderiales bacterium]
MSRIGKAPIALPAKVEVTLTADQVTVKGPLGSLSHPIDKGVAVEKNGDTLVVSLKDPMAGAVFGTTRALLANMVKGVAQGFERKLTLVGVGFRAQLSGNALNLSLGFSHPVVHKLPEGIKAELPQQTEIIIKGIDKQVVGQVAADIRAYRPPEPYKGKGVRYADERVILKETKKK